jgi:hypothetical protein
MTTENIIISNLIYNAEYRDKVLPHIKDEYFQDRSVHWTFKIVRAYVTKYNKSPTKEILLTELAIVVTLVKRNPEKQQNSLRNLQRNLNKI